jgi:putative redox protein
LDSERAETDPKVFTRIHMHFVVKGRGLADAKVKRAIDLSIEKYCSATAMLSKTATVTHDYEVIDTTTRPTP